MIDDAYSKVLLHFNGADATTVFRDESEKVWTAGGNAQIDTALQVFGSGSGLFDGAANSYISTPDHADFVLGSDDWTFDFRVRFSDVANPSVPTFYSQYEDSDNYFVIHYVVATNILECVQYESGADVWRFKCDFTPVVDTWYHIAFIRDGNTPRITVGGDLQTITEVVTISGKTAANLGGIVYIGSLSTTQMIEASIDEFRFSSGIARWSENFTILTLPYNQSVPTIDGFEAWWELEEHSGTRYDDIGDNDLTDTNTVLYATGVDGNDCALFDGDNSESLEINDNAELSFGDEDFSVGCFVFPTTNGFKGFIAKYDYGYGFYEYALREYYHGDGNHFRFSISGDGTTSYMVENEIEAIQLSSWYFLVAVHDSKNDKIRLYVSYEDNTGIHESEVAYALGCNNNTAKFALGSMMNSGVPGSMTYGRIDKAFVVRKALSAAEIEWLFNSGEGRISTDLDEDFAAQVIMM